METRFTWSAAKASANLRKHGVSFETARLVFSDPFHLVVENHFVEGEQRYMAIGMIDGLALVATVYVDRSEPGVAVIRIISARKAVAYEQSAYEDQFH